MSQAKTTRPVEKAPAKADAPAKSLTARRMIQLLKQRIADGERLDEAAETAKIVANHGEPADD